MSLIYYLFEYDLILHTAQEWQKYPDSKVRGANMGPIWGRQDPGGPHIGPMNFAIWVGPSSDKELTNVTPHLTLVQQSYNTHPLTCLIID